MSKPGCRLPATTRATAGRAWSGSTLQDGRTFAFGSRPETELTRFRPPGRCVAPCGFPPAGRRRLAGRWPLRDRGQHEDIILVAEQIAARRHVAAGPQRLPVPWIDGREIAQALETNVIVRDRPQQPRAVRDMAELLLPQPGLVRRHPGAGPKRPSDRRPSPSGPGSTAVGPRRSFQSPTCRSP